MANRKSVESLAAYMIEYDPYDTPKKDEDSHTLDRLLLSKRNVDESSHESELRNDEFCKRVVAWLVGLIGESKVDMIAVVPRPLESQNFLKEIAGRVFEELGLRGLNLLDGRSLLERFKDVVHLDRFKRDHKRSIKVTEPERVKGKAVCVVDDIWTSGATLRACRDLLLEAGAKQVKLYAIAKSKTDDACAMPIQKESTTGGELERTDQEHIKNYLLRVPSSWKDIGLLLGLELEDLNAIEEQNKSTEICIDQMVKNCLTESKATRSATLKTLVEAIAGGKDPLTVAMFEKDDYMKALAEGPSLPVRYLRLMLIGPSSVGKTSLLRRLMGKKLGKASSTKMAETHHFWVQTEEETEQWQKVTEEMEIKELAVLLRKSKETLTTSSESPSSDNSDTTSDTESMSGDSSPNSSCREALPKETSSAKKPQCLKVEESSFKTDLEAVHDRVTRDMLMKAFMLDKKVKENELDLNREIFLHVWDCGGQPVYLNALPPFLSALSAFLLVFDASIDLEENVKLIWYDDDKKLDDVNLPISYTDLFKQWLAAIDSYLPRQLKMFENKPRPRVILVGTHGQGVEISDNAIKQKFKGPAFYDLLDNKVCLVENSKSTGFDELKKAIQDIAVSFTLQTPVKWVLFRKILNKIAESEPTLSLDRAIAIGKLCNIAKEDVPKVLDFYHELGVFLYFHEMPESVIASPKWLVKNLGSLICHEKQLLKTSTKKNAIDLFCNYGILVNELYDDILGSTKVNLLKILQMFFLATPVTINLSDSIFNGNEGYFIPAMLSQSQTESTPPKCHFSTGSLCLRLADLNYIPPGYFVQLVVALTKNTDLIVDTSTAGYNCIAFQYKTGYIVTVSSRSNSCIEITLSRKKIRKKNEFFFFDTCQDVFRAILNSAKGLPLTNIVYRKQKFKVQPALMCNSCAKMHNIQFGQKLDDEDICTYGGRIDSNAKLWLTGEIVTSCNIERVTQVVKLIKEESGEESFFELVNFLELPGYDCKSMRSEFWNYFFVWLEGSQEKAVAQLLFHLKRLEFKEHYSNLIKEERFSITKPKSCFDPKNKECREKGQKRKQSEDIKVDEKLGYLTDEHLPVSKKIRMSNYGTELAEEHLDMMITDEDINEVSRFLVNWEQVANQLGVDKVEITDIQQASGIKLVTKNHRALTAWRNTEYKEATYRKLIETLEKLHEGECAGKVYKLLDLH